MPAYFDVRYNTRIELLRFDSRRPHPRFIGLIEGLKAQLAHVRVVANPGSIDFIPEASHVAAAIAGQGRGRLMLAVQTAAR